MRPALSIFSSKPFRRAVSVLLLLAMVLGGAAFLGRLLRLEDGARVESFFTQDTEYDVLFFGSSHMVNGIYPMYLWQAYGIPAYNLAGHGCRPSMAYWVLKMALKYHKPQAAVLDVLFCWEESSELSTSLAHNILDPFPASLTKTQAIWDLYSADKDRAELLFPLDVYHNRWKELDSAMVRKALGEPVEPLPEKGAESRIYVNGTEESYVLTGPEEQAEDFTLEMDYIQKFIALCQENDIVPIITYLPCETSVWSQKCCNRAMDMAKAQGALTLNLEYENSLNNLTDWADGPDHVNPAGARKLTDAVGQFLQDSLSLPDRREEPGYGDWQRDLEAYYAFQWENMEKADTPEKILALATLPNFRVELESAPGYTVPRVLLEQLAELGDRGTLAPLRESTGTEVLRLTVRDEAGLCAMTRSYSRTLEIEGGGQ